jgi:L,D-peptidoglycan transpeptidase YkuD (ErfK/YbiS/YcfS/YnhG family)
MRLDLFLKSSRLSSRRLCRGRMKNGRVISRRQQLSQRPNIKEAAYLDNDAIVRAISRKGAPPQSTALGGLIYIHGNGASSDWTWGCVALENEDIDELYRAIPEGTPVTIKP